MRQKFASSGWVIWILAGSLLSNTDYRTTVVRDYRANDSPSPFLPPFLSFSLDQQAWQATGSSHPHNRYRHL